MMPACHSRWFISLFFYALLCCCPVPDCQSHSFLLFISCLAHLTEFHIVGLTAAFFVKLYWGHLFPARIPPSRSVCAVCILSLIACISSRGSKKCGWKSKLPIVYDYASVCPAMSWNPIQGVHQLLSYAAWNRLQPPKRPSRTGVWHSWWGLLQAR